MARSNSKIGKKMSKREKSMYKNWVPQQLTQLPALKPIPMLPCMSNLGKVKSWVPSSPCNTITPCKPQLMLLFNSTDSSNDSSSCYNRINCLTYNYASTDYRLQPHGSHWRFAKVAKYNVDQRFPFRRWDSPFKYASRSSNDETCSGAIRAELTYDSSPALMLSCLNEHDQHAWIRHECTVIDPFDAKKRCMQFTRILTGNDGKIYALSLQGTLAVVEDVDSRLMITGISSSRGVPSVSSRYFKEYFVKFVNGDILLVFLIYKRSLEVVDQVKVFRLCCDKLKWIKVERLDGKALFLDKCGIWANPEEFGCKRNCVYFTQGSDNGWWVYDIEKCCISPAPQVQ